MLAHSKLTPWLMWFLAVFFYFYQFIIRVATGNMREPLTLEFNLTAGEYGMFASYWLVSYALLQIPIGIALDKWGVRKVFTVSAFLCGVGTLITAQTESYAWLCFARLLIGAGSAPAFIGTFKISSEWFKPSLLPILVGVISGIGVLGASLAG
ncbi:MAG: MFS transporter, partial [Alphaproteobacteria bacterium]|nr:MFS transporter [Alphaproteobacteria bacterium]